MSDEKLIPKVIISQLEDLLEERQDNDRRKNKEEIPESVKQDRRVKSRREGKK